MTCVPLHPVRCPTLPQGVPLNPNMYGLLKSLEVVQISLAEQKNVCISLANSQFVEINSNKAIKCEFV
jgi:hypothetical protein